MTAPLKPIQHLQKARDLIAQPGKWTQGAMARDANGSMVDPKEASAVCFCVLGALRYADDHPVRMHTRNRVYLDRAVGGSSFQWNDAIYRTQTEVVAAFDRAIALARSEGR